MFLEITKDKFTQGCSQILAWFKYLTKNDILQPFISQPKFLTSDENALGANTVDLEQILYVFDILYQNKISSAQRMKICDNWRSFNRWCCCICFDVNSKVVAKGTDIFF